MAENKIYIIALSDGYTGSLPCRYKQINSCFLNDCWCDCGGCRQEASREDSRGVQRKARLLIGRNDEERPSSQGMEWFGSS